MRLLVGVLDFIFGCHHGEMSRVFTIEGRTYRVCCGCGAEFDYSLQSMTTRRITKRTRHVVNAPAPLPVYNSTKESAAGAAV